MRQKQVEKCFSLKKQQEYLPKLSFKKVKNSLQNANLKAENNCTIKI